MMSKKSDSDNSIAKLIQQKALDLGYEKCGIIPIEMMTGYEEKFNERTQKVPQSQPFYQNQQRLIRFQEDFEWAKSIVVLVKRYSKYRIPESLKGHIAKHYLTDSRINENTKEFQSSTALEQYMQELGLRTATNRKFGIVGVRWAALQAGLGIIRRNNFFYTESGSFISLEAYLTDCEMELIEKPDLPPCPPNCNRCMKACTTASLSDAYTMNPLRCISFLTTFGGRNLPNEPLASDFGDWIYGCDMCQDACPMNHNKWTGQNEFPGLSELEPYLTMENILEMDEDFYRQNIQPKFFYLSPDELWKWQVNVLNFMDNRYEDHFAPAIIKAQKSKYEQVREMAEIISTKHNLESIY
ncbi:4Fe-4S double cluster binding domain-containing protein [Lacrimispora sp.]|uniref:epoxyqueuosine reductase n=1 Tax=Lacrimispora sp. TaxID=2719234 RepID=UPI0032E52E1D